LILKALIEVGATPSASPECRSGRSQFVNMDGDHKR